MLTVKLPRDAELCGVFEYQTDQLEVRGPDGVFVIRQTIEGLSIKAPGGDALVLRAGKPPRQIPAPWPATNPVVVARPGPRKTECPNCHVTIEYLPGHVRQVKGLSLGDDGPAFGIQCPECRHWAKPAKEDP